MMRNKVQIMNTACDAHFGESVLNFLSNVGIRVSNFEYAVFPGFCDVHVHFREPGFSYKETILSGSKCAARGGYTAVLSSIRQFQIYLCHVRFILEIVLQLNTRNAQAKARFLL